MHSPVSNHQYFAITKYFNEAFCLLTKNWMIRIQDYFTEHSKTFVSETEMVASSTNSRKL